MADEGVSHGRTVGMVRLLDNGLTGVVSARSDSDAHLTTELGPDVPDATGDIRRLVRPDMTRCRGRDGHPERDGDGDQYGQHCTLHGASLLIVRRAVYPTGKES